MSRASVRRAEGIVRGLVSRFCATRGRGAGRPWGAPPVLQIARVRCPVSRSPSSESALVSVARRLLGLPLVQLLDGSSRRVLVVVEDGALAELLLDALMDAGHAGELLAEGADLRAAIGVGQFDAVIIDLDTRARTGPELVALVREAAPRTTVIALLPCGGLPSNHPRLAYHLAVEKPARLGALLSALAAAPAHPRN